MIVQLQEQDLSLVLEYRFRMMVDAGAAEMLAADWRELTGAYYSRGYRDGTCVHFGWQVDGKVVACAGVVIRNDFPHFTFKTRRFGWIMDVYVLPEYRRKGIARILTEHTLAWLRERGVVVARLIASDGARQAGLYEKLGFVPTSEMKIRLASPS